jgi:hypothetical protein
MFCAKITRTRLISLDAEGVGASSSPYRGTAEAAHAAKAPHKIEETRRLGLRVSTLNVLTLSPKKL